MSDDLSKRMENAVGEGSRPGAHEAWAEAQRRIRRGRTVTAALVVLAVVGVAALAAAALANRPETQQVSSGPAVASTTSLADVTCDPPPSMEDGPPPATASDFVNVGSGQASGPSDVVARVKVLRSWWLEPESTGPDEQSWQHRVELEVTDPVIGAEVGDRLEVFDAMAMGGATEPEGVIGPTCHAFEVGDDLIVGLAGSPTGSGDEPYELNGSSAFFVITDGRFSPELDAARRSLARMQPAWAESELLQDARDLTPDQFLDLLRAEVPSSEGEGDEASWTVSPDDPPSPAGSTFTALVTRSGCAGGQTGEVLEPQVDVRADRIVVTTPVAPLPAGAYTCPGNDAVPVEIDLGEPLGDRPIFDGRCTTDGPEGTVCAESGRRWPP